MGHSTKKDESVNIEQEVIRNLLEAACAVRHDLNIISSDINISRSQMGVLHILKEAYPEGCSRGQIIEGLVEACPDVTRLVDRLAEEGLVERYRSKEDARVSVAKITDKGIDVYDKAREIFLKYLDSISDILTQSECEILSELCKKISKSMPQCKSF